MPVNNPFALVAGLQYVDGTASTATSFSGTVAMSFNASNLIVGLRSDASDNLLVTGTLTHNNAAPIGNNFGVLPAVASSAAPTYTAGDQVLLSTDLAGNLRVNATFTGTATNNITQWNSVNLGSPSAYGTSPGAVNVIGVNAFVTNTVTVSGTVTANQGGAPWSMNLTQLNGTALGSGTNWATAPATSVNVQGVNAEMFVGQNAVSATAPVPVSATAAANTSGNPIFVSAAVTGTVAVTQSTSPWVVSLTSTTITGTVAVTQSTSPWTVQGDSASGAANAGNPVKIGGAFNTTQPTVTNGQTVDAQMTARGAQIVAVGVDGFAVTVGGTVAVTQSTSPWVVSLTSTTITGTVAVTQSTSPWVVSGGLTHNNAAPAANNVGVLPAVASTAAPTYTTGDQVLLSTDLSGNLRVTFAAASEQNVNLNQWAGTALGTPANYGTSPGAVVAGSVNAFVTNTVPVTLTSTTITGTVAVTQSTSPWVIAGALTNNNAAPAATNIGVLSAIAETAYTTVTYTTGDQVIPVTDLHGALNQDLQAYAGTQLTGTVTAYGTAPTGNVFGVNANVTNTVAVTLTSTTITGTVAVTQSTSPWVIAGNKTNNNAAPGATNEGVLPAVANAATQTWTEGNLVLESVDLSGRQRVRGTLTHNNAAPIADQLSVIPALANAATPTFTEGDQVLLSTDLSGNIRAIEKKDTGRTYITWFIDAIAGVTTEALVSLQVNKGGTLQTAGTTYTVTAGKTLRLQSISMSVQETNGTVQWLKLRVRSAAAVTATSPVIAGLLVATDAGNTNNSGYGDQSFPDGLEIAGGQQVGISQVTGSTSTNVTVTLVGYEY